MSHVKELFDFISTYLNYENIIIAAIAGQREGQHQSQSSEARGQRSEV